MNTRIANIGQLVTPVPRGPQRGDSTLLDVRANTELLIRDGRIAVVGAADQRERIDVEIDACGGVLLPGLVDPHTHFPLPTEPDVSRSPVATPRRVRDRLRRALFSGVTTVEVKCGDLETLGELSSIARSGDEALPEIVATLFGVAPRPGVAPADEMAALIGDAIPTVRRRQLARFCDVECGDGAYTLQEARTILRAARAAGLHLKLHATGGNIGALGSVAAELGIGAVGHPCEIDIWDAEEWMRVGLIPVLLPGEGLIHGKPCLTARQPLESGLTVGFGTNAGAGPVAVGSMWLVVALAVSMLGMSIERTIASVTLQNAHVLESASEIGSVEPGKRADLVILDVVDYRDLLGGLGEEPVRIVIRSGEVVHRR